MLFVTTMESKYDSQNEYPKDADFERRVNEMEVSSHYSEMHLNYEML